MQDQKDGGVVLTGLRYIFGDVPAQWIRLVLLGAALTYAVFYLRDFGNKMQAESEQVRSALTTAVAANTAWQEMSQLDRDVLILRTNRRFKKVYDRLNMDYEEIEK